MSLCKRKLESSSEDHESKSKIPKPNDGTSIEAEEEQLDRINQLPVEVLDMILSYLGRRVRKNVRLVCKLWYDRGYFDETLHINPADNFVHHRNLENCGFKHFKLYFECTDTTSCRLPESVWEKIGTKIHSLKLLYCRLGNRTVESILSQCENLQVLEIGLGTYDLEESFCSLETLKKLNVVREKLHTLDIFYPRSCRLTRKFKCRNQAIDTEKWKQIFCALRRIFPNVKNYSSGSHLISPQQHRLIFRMKFSLESTSGVDKSHLRDALGYSMPHTNNVDWRRALQALSTVSLTSVSLKLGCVNYEQEDADALMNFFTHQEKLKKIELKLWENQIRYGSGEGVEFPEVLALILIHILDKCPQLREFYFLNDWFSGLEKTQYAQVVTKTSRLTKFSINDLIIDGSTIQQRSSSLRNVCLFKRMSFAVQYYSHVQHLLLGIRPELYSLDIDLICQCMPNLKTLEINVTNWVFQKDSFKRLQNLERLTLHGSDRQKLENRDWYKEFEFPKLRYLYCFLPEEASLLDCIGTKLPALKEVDFSQTDCEMANYFGKFAQDILQGYDVLRIFARCPTLQSLRYYRGTYFYEPFSQKVIFTEKE